MKKEPDIASVDGYLAQQTAEIRKKLEQIREIIKSVAPEAIENLSYQMPSFNFHGKLAYYAAFKEHYSLFVMPDVLRVFKDKLNDYSLSKSAIRIPNDQQVPEELFREILGYAVEANLEKKRIKDEMKKKGK